MGDRASLSVTVHACPREQARVIVSALEDLNMDFVPPGHGRGLVLGEAYIDGQTPLDVPGRLAEHLTEHTPGAAFTVHGGSYSPEPAEVHLHVPGLGLYSSEASDTEEPRFSTRQFGDWINEWAAADRDRDPHNLDPDELRALVRARTGGAHQDRIEELRAGLSARDRPVIVRPVWPCRHCGRPVREQDRGTPFARWTHADTGALMRACADGAAHAEPDTDPDPVFGG